MLPDGVNITDSNGRILTNENVRMRIKELREIVKGHKELGNFPNHDAFLLRFLYPSKCNVESAFTKMTEYYKLIVNNPEWFNIISAEDNKQLLRKQIRIMLSDRDREGRCIYLMKLGNIDASVLTLKDVIRLDDLWLESQADDPLTQCKGCRIIIDASDYSYKLFQWATPSNIRFGTRKLETLPVKELIIHVVKASFFANASMKIIWPFLGEKLRKSLIFHYDDLESLQKYISPESLPREYGGTADVDYDKLIQKLIDGSNELVERMKYIKCILSSK